MCGYNQSRHGVKLKAGDVGGIVELFWVLKRARMGHREVPVMRAVVPNLSEKQVLNLAFFKTGV
jgi:hypothetical protein